MKYGDKIDPTTGGEARYFYSRALDRDGKIDKDMGVITIKDTLQGKPCMVVYEPGETELLRQAGGVDKGVHMVKKVFGGEVVGVGDVAGKNKG